MAEQLVEVPTVLSPLRIEEQTVGIPVPSVERISERIVEQTVDISPGGGLGQGSASSAGAADEDFTGGFSHFSSWKKVRSAGQEVSAQLGGYVSSSTPSAHQTARAGEPVDSDGSDVWVLMRPPDIGKSYYWNKRTNLTAWDPPAEQLNKLCLSPALLEGGFAGGCAGR